MTGPGELSLVLAVVVAMLLIGLLGVLIDSVLLDRIRRNFLAQVVTTIGIILIIRDVLLTRYAGLPVSVARPEVLNGRASLLGVELPRSRWLLIVGGLVVFVLVELLMTRTKVGMRIRASVDDREMARAIGIPVLRLFRWVFGIGAALAAMAGVMAGLVSTVDPVNDIALFSLALIVVILGGLGSTRGAAIAALLVGVISQMGIAVMPQMANFVLYIPVVLILAIRPWGVFGARLNVVR